MRLDVEPEPTDEEREAIAGALQEGADDGCEWLEAALLEGVDADEP